VREFKSPFSAPGKVTTFHENKGTFRTYKLWRLIPVHPETNRPKTTTIWLKVIPQPVHPEAPPPGFSLKNMSGPL
jgi:hypothetical protein